MQEQGRGWSIPWLRQAIEWRGTQQGWDQQHPQHPRTHARSGHGTRKWTAGSRSESAGSSTKAHGQRRKQTRPCESQSCNITPARANKHKQTQANTSKHKQTQASKHKQANTDLGGIVCRDAQRVAGDCHECRCWRDSAIHNAEKRLLKLLPRRTMRACCTKQRGKPQQQERESISAHHITPHHTTQQTITNHSKSTTKHDTRYHHIITTSTPV